MGSRAGHARRPRESVHGLPSVLVLGLTARHRFFRRALRTALRAFFFARVAALFCAGRAGEARDGSGEDAGRESRQHVMGRLVPVRSLVGRLERHLDVARVDRDHERARDRLTTAPGGRQRAPFLEHPGQRGRDGQRERDLLRRRGTRDEVLVLLQDGEKRDRAAVCEPGWAPERYGTQSRASAARVERARGRLAFAVEARHLSLRVAAPAERTSG